MTETQTKAEQEFKLRCRCGWEGTIEEQDVLLAEYGGCPWCGNEMLNWIR